MTPRKFTRRCSCTSCVRSATSLWRYWFAIQGPLNFSSSSSSTQPDSSSALTRKKFNSTSAEFYSFMQISRIPYSSSSSRFYFLSLGLAGSGNGGSINEPLLLLEEDFPLLKGIHSRFCDCVKNATRFSAFFVVKEKLRKCCSSFVGKFAALIIFLILRGD